MVQVVSEAVVDCKEMNKYKKSDRYKVDLNCIKNVSNMVLIKCFIFYSTKNNNVPNEVFILPDSCYHFTVFHFLHR